MAHKRKKLNGGGAASPATTLLTLWGELEPGVTVNLLALKSCSVCGQPARASVYDLKRQQRTLLCGTCHQPSVAKG